LERYLIIFFKIIGPIWLNINYLSLKSLYEYKDVSKNLNVKNIYQKLRNNLIKNLAKNFKIKNTIFEQYNPINGKGFFNY
jgi:mannosyl-oligosaccharide glucosidase